MGLGNHTTVSHRIVMMFRTFMLHSGQIYFETKFVWILKLFIMQVIVILARHGFYSRINLFPTVVSCHAAGEGFDKL